MTAMELMNALGEAEEELTWPVLNARTRRPRRTLRALLVAAAMLVLLALAALAASESGLLARWFPESYDLIEEYVSHVEAVSENDTLRLTLHEAVTDGARTLVAYSVERLDGGSMAGWSPETEIDLRTAQGRVFLTGSRSEMTVGQEEAAKRTYLWVCNSSDEAALAGVSLRLLGLEQASGGGRLDAGALRLEADLSACPVRAARRVGDPSDRELVVSIRLSPLSLHIRSLRNLAGMTPENAEPVGVDSAVGAPPDTRVELLFRNGSRRDVTGAMTQRSKSSEGWTVLSGGFWELPDVSRVKAVVIDGREYPLAKEPAPQPRTGLRGADYLESLRAWLFGSHVPVNPALEAAGTRVKLSADSIWTDGITTELLLAIEAPQEEAFWLPVNEGGYLTFAAQDGKGNPLAVAAETRAPGLGLLALVVECSGKAAQLTVGDVDAALTIPLDMRKLAALPQIEPIQAGDPGEGDADLAEAYWQAAYDSLFGGLAPDDTGYTGNNGEYELKLAHLYLTETPGEVSLRGWAEARRLDGKPYVMSEETLRAFLAFGLKDGEEVRLSGGMGHTGGMRDGVRVFCLNWSWYYGDFSVIEGLEEAGLPTDNLDLTPLDLDALRVVWTPPEGDRITLDLPFTG